MEVVMPDSSSCADSTDLASGLTAWRTRIAPLVGRTVTVRTVDGQEHTGTFGDSLSGECQPQITDSDGRRWRVLPTEMDRLMFEAALARLEDATANARAAIRKGQRGGVERE